MKNNHYFTRFYVIVFVLSLFKTIQSDAQVATFTGETPIEEINQRTGDFGPTYNSNGAFSCNYNRARGIISIGAEVQSDGYASWDRFTVYFYYNGQWVEVFETTHRNRGNANEAIVTQNQSNATGNYGINSTQYSTQFGYDATSGYGTSYRNVHQSWSNGSADREHNIYLKNFNNLKLYNYTYLPLTGTVTDRTDISQDSIWSLQFDKYTSTVSFPVSNGPDPASNIVGGYDVNNEHSFGNVDGINYVQYSATLGALVFNISNLPPDMISSPSFKVRLYAHHDLETHSRICITTYNNENPMQNAPTGLTASTNTCGMVSLSWSNSSNTLPTEDTMTLKNVIFRNGVYLGMVNGNETSYNDLTAVQNVTYSYTIRHIAFSTLGKTYYQSNPSNTAQGNIKPTPDIAVSPDASQDKCTNEIDVSWQYNSTSPQNFRIDRSTSSAGSYSVLATLSGNDRLYVDTTVIRGQQYFYRIYSINTCNVLSLGAASVGGSSIANPQVATGITAIFEPDSSYVNVHWTDVANNETAYQVIRQDDLGNTVFFDINQNDTTFLDDGVSTCREYTYKIKVFNECVNAGLIAPQQPSVLIPPPNISSTFDSIHKLTGSKGYFTNRVELSYSVNNAQNLDLIKVYRKILGTTDSTLIASVNPSSGLYVDNTADARVYYEYSMIGEKNCNGTNLYSNLSKDVGFRNPLGTISGHIEFTGGIAVKDAKIVATPSSGDAGYALAFSGGSATVADAANLEFGNQLRLDFWIKPTSSTSGTILGKGTAFSFEHSGSNYIVSVKTSSVYSITFSESYLPLNSWKPISVQYNGSSMFVLVNGVQVGSVAMSDSVENNTADFVIGNSAAQFKLDELRIFSVATDSATAVKDSYRYLNGNENGFRLSAHFDEGVGTSAYDVSKQGNVYNANHLKLSGNYSWSTDRPTSAELSYITYTDSLGNYLISGIRYNGYGDNYTIVPSKGVHSFSPSSRSNYIGDLSQVFNNQDFTDISSFTTTGTVRYYNPDGTPTNCYVPSAGLYVDGQPVIQYGTQVLTDASGFFSIQVPIGTHMVSVSKFQHDFSDSSFTNNFQNTVSGLEFKDTTTRVVTGRVVGGLIEAVKTPGLGLSTNNVGVAKIRFVSPITASAATACFMKEIYTDAQTGEYTVKLPPLQYKIDTVFVVSQPNTVNPSSLTNSNTVVNLVSTLNSTTVFDTVYTQLGAQVDSMSYDKLLNFIYRVVPTVNFTDTLGNKFIGDDSLTASGTTFPIGLSTISASNPWGAFYWPVFTQGKTYYGLVSANEIYTNTDNSIIDTVPLQGQVNFTNDLVNGTDPNASIDLVNGQAMYNFIAGDPNNSTGSIAAFDYTKTLQISVVPEGASAVLWKPNVTAFPSNPEYRAYILGSVITGTGVATLGPERVDYILRDPAGSGSFATWTTGTSKTIGSSFSLNVGATQSTSASITTGFEQSVGLGVQIPVEVEVESGVGLSVSASATVGGAFSETITYNSSVSTRDDEDHVGAEADIFIGRSRNWLVGPTNNIELIDSSQCIGSTICFGPVVNGQRLSKKLGYAIQPSTVKTRFSYTQSEIESLVIPYLESIRSTKLVAPMYTNILPASDPRYGANNDDPVFGTAVSTATPNVYEANDTTGVSYTYHGGVMGSDTVRTINQQIALWKQALARNEREKWLAINNQGGVLIDNFTLGSAIVSNSYELNSSAEFTMDWELSMSSEEKLEISAEAGGVGAGVEYSLSLSETVGGSVGTSTSSTTSFEYTLTDGDDGDNFSIDVYESAEGTGNIFVTRGGRSMCPYEGAVQPHYFDPANPSAVITSHTYIANPSATIQLATIQREIPHIVITPSQQYNIPSNQSASFQLILTNQSPEVVDNDIDMRVRVASQSNPNGAIVKIDGLDPNTYYTIPAGANVVKTLTVERGPIYTNYDSLMIIFSSACSEDIADTAYISVHFIPTCTELDFTQPTNNWILNNDNDNNLLVKISDYNYNYGAATITTSSGPVNLGFNKIGFEMKPSTSSNWLQIEQFLKYPGVTDSVIPSNDIVTQYPWNVASIPDGNYELRAKSYCLNFDGSLSTLTSPVYAGVMDRINPQPFGTPSPADGILDPNDDISIQFNEPIDLGSIGWNNFQVRGVLNNGDVRHAEYINFDGTTNYVEVPGGVGLQNKDFTLEFWARATVSGNNQTIISQGIDPNESMAVGFNTTDNLKFNINGQEVVSNNTVSNITDWNHYAVVYDYTNNKGYLYQNGNLLNAGNVDFLANYNGSGKLYFGKKVPSNTEYYNGNLHEVRVWNKQRSAGDIVQYMNTVLSVNSSGLVHNWQMDEAEGTIAEDKIRQRNAVLYGAGWQVDPSGFAGSFDGSDDYLKVNAASIPVTSTMDATVEFWFNSAQTAAATMFSSGKGDGLAGDSLIGWEINKDATGKIHVKHHGLDFVAVDSNYFDGTWHHFALVLNRNANLSAYIDGNLQNGVQSTNYGAMSGPYFTVGARGYILSGGTYTQDNYFQGMLDEVRVWNVARKLEQVKRDIHNRLKGDEFGLMAYAPFETYNIVLNVPVLGATISNQATDHATDTITGMNGVITVSQTPLIKIPRPVENVNFTWSLNNDKIVITPTTAPELLENQTIDITVEELFDEHGNQMQSPKTWIAYFNKNQVYWSDDAMDFDIVVDSVLNFSATILNTGGALKQWTLSGIPSWMTASSTSGTISPNSQQTIQFTVPAGINVGEYYADIALTTDFNYDEILRVSVKVNGNPPNWVLNTNNYQYSMSVIGEIELDGIINGNTETMIAGFQHDSLCALGHLQYVSSYDRYEVFLNLLSNQQMGDSITFKVYDANTGNVYIDVTPTIYFVDGDVLGSLANPVTFSSTLTLMKDIYLNNGWTWISLPLASADQVSTDNLLFNVSASNGNIVKSQSSYDQFDTQTGWIGTISGNGGYLNAAAYKVKLSTADTLHLIGHKIHPDSADAIIHVVPGYNWIGFVSMKNLGIDEALGNYPALDGDLIKSQYEFAYYDSINATWTGSLTTLRPGFGYILHTNQTNSFSYPISTYLHPSSMAVQTVTPYYEIHEELFEKTMSLVATSNMCTANFDANELLLGAFNQQGELRGSVLPKKDENSGNTYYYLTVYGDAYGDKFMLKFIDNSNGTLYPTDLTLEFEPDAFYGTNTLPLLANVDVAYACTIASESISDSENETSGSFEVEPNPFDQSFSVSFGKERSGKLELLNAQGQLIFSSEFYETDKFQFESIKASAQLANGLYILQVTFENGDVEKSRLLKITK